MPLGAKLTQNDFKRNFLKWILTWNCNRNLSRLFERTQTIFQRLKEILTWEMTKMPLGAKLTRK